LNEIAKFWIGLAQLTNQFRAPSNDVDSFLEVFAR
jgi:hypothetical protein